MISGIDSNNSFHFPLIKQCTPVQLEILRRAGAMPVSSRRCGMITRREAERLCKSFLGDNSPPRLPDDFSFLVYHECAFGCRGAFLPSRYNSSRAKCIKCSYCGLFFSPNKFIFHSHRISPNDKYVQPDAANFNSWRRHLKLSGTPTDNIIHAWEDVKAMFNGGTRKRLVSSPITQSHSQTQNLKSEVARKSKEMQNYNSQYPSRPTQPIQQPHGNSVTSNDTHVNNPPLTDVIAPLKSSSSTSAPFHQDLPFSLSHYVWHYQQQTQSISLNTPGNANKANNFQFPTLNWIKQQPSTLPSTFLFKPNNTSIAPINALSKDEKPPSTFNHFHSAAFKPVINMRLPANDESNIPTLNHNHSPTSSTNQSDDERLTPAKKFLTQIKYGKEKESDLNANENNVHEEIKPYEQNTEYDTKNNSQSDDESEMVDIESTEDDVNILNLQSFHSKSSEKDEDEEIEVDEKVERFDNNNTTSYKGKNAISSLTDITSNIEMQENYFIKKHYVNFSSSGDKEWQLKKEVS